MRGLRLWKGAIRFLLGGMDEIRKLDRILNEEDGNVVADKVPVSLHGVELHGKTAHIPRKIGRPFVAGDGREPHEGRGLLTRPLKQIGPGMGGKGFIGLEVAMGSIATSMNHTLGDSFVIEMENLLAEMEIIHDKRAARTNSKRVLVIRYRPALSGRQHGLLAGSSLMQFAAGSPNKLLVVNGGSGG